MEPSSPTFIAICICCFIAAGGIVMILYAAIRQGVLRGLACRRQPGGKSFVCRAHWSGAKKGLRICLFGLALMFGIAFTMPDARTEIAKKFPGIPFLSSPRVLTAEIQEHRERIERLEAEQAQSGPALAQQFKQLDARRKALKPGDDEAITKYNEEAAAYSAQNARLTQTRKEIETASQELSDLLAERSRSAPRKQTPVADPNQIVIYSMQRCRACQMAKQHLRQKGLSYEERDIETSPEALQEYQQMGGEGVPLILVGGRRMNGYSPQEIEALR